MSDSGAFAVAGQRSNKVASRHRWQALVGRLPHGDLKWPIDAMAEDRM
jgi:hypothetical protein